MTMPQIDYENARQKLKTACHRYSINKAGDLSCLYGESPIKPSSLFFQRAVYYKTAGNGFLYWIACKYAYLFDRIADLNQIVAHRSGYIHRYANIYPACEHKIKFLDDLCTEVQEVQEEDIKTNEIVLDRINVLIGLLLFIMVDQNKEPDFEEDWKTYAAGKAEGYVCLKDDPISVQTYKSLMKLDSLIRFVDTLPQYNERSGYVLNAFNSWHRVFENYRKQLVADEFETILSDDKLSAEEAVKAVALQLKNPITSELLAINQQSETECFLKKLCLILVVVGIGVIPTLLLASKRLIQTGGTSINFFKSLSQNLAEDIEDVASQLPPSKPQ